MKIEFSEPPAQNRSQPPNAKHLAVAKTLRSRPGQWAKWPFKIKDPYALQNRISNGTSSFPKGEFEAMTRNKVVYVRAKP